MSSPNLIAQGHHPDWLQTHVDVSVLGLMTDPPSLQDWGQHGNSRFPYDASHPFTTIATNGLWQGSKLLHAEQQVTQAGAARLRGACITEIRCLWTGAPLVCNSSAHSSLERGMLQSRYVLEAGTHHSSNAGQQVVWGPACWSWYQRDEAKNSKATSAEPQLQTVSQPDWADLHPFGSKVWSTCHKFVRKLTQVTQSSLTVLHS